MLGFDHHCPWIGKCIGRYNIKGFYIFIGLLMALIVYAILLYFAIIFLIFFGKAVM